MVDLNDFADIAPRPARRGSEPADAVEDARISSALPVQWSVSGKVYCPTTLTVKTLPGGLYQVGQDQQGNIVLSQVALKVDTLITFPDGMANKILKEAETFWGLTDTFTKFGFLHRRGYLLYGPAGGGKTCVVQQIIAGVIEKGGLAIICVNPDLMAAGLSAFRTVEPKRPLVCVFEDIDAIISRHGDATLLSILDGENQVDLTLNIATTNYPELLDKRLVSRPRRFDRVVKIQYPDPTVRRQYFATKLEDPKEIEEWVEISEDLSFASLAELVISVKCLGNPLEEAAKSLRDLCKKKSSVEDTGLGFK